MTETELKTDATQALANIQAETAKLETDAKADVAKVKGQIGVHMAWIIGIGCMLLGFVAGWCLHLK